MTLYKQTLRIYLSYVLRYKKLFAVVQVLLPTIILAEFILVPFLGAKALDTLAAGNSSLSDFTGILIGVVALELYAVIFWRVLVRALWYLESNIMRDMSNDIFKHLLNQSYQFHTDRFGGALVSQANKFVSAFERLFDTFIFNIGTLFWNFLFIVLILAPRAPLYVVVLLIISTAFVFATVKLKSRERPLVANEAKADTETTAQLADSITNFMTVKSFARELAEFKRYSDRTDERRNRSLDVMRLTLRHELFLATIYRSLNVSALLIAIIAVIEFNTPLSILFLIVNYTTTLMRRLWDINNIFKNINRSFGDAQDMTTILQLKPSIADITNPVESHISRGDIRIEDVTYAYGKSHKPLFKDFSLHIKPGEKVGLVGRSGSGKTTLSKLLLRMMDIQKGNISIDGFDIAKLRQADARAAIAYVPQEPLMFHRSIAENISYGAIDTGHEAVEAAAKMANAHDFIIDLPHGYDTLVGERGTKLSGGQRQRVAIARAMLKNAPILLLDEATSALDSESEMLIQSALWRLMEGKTAIVIAHRLSTIQKMDRIVVMDKGQIIEEGSHNELLSRKGTYADLWNRQSGGFLEN